jgi:Zn finger protein HypA/HybF involved in hydrogenase expression
MMEVDDLLARCPRCGAWPMAASLSGGAFGHGKVRFRCPKCQGEEVGWIRTLRPLRVFWHHPSAERREPR